MTQTEVPRSPVPRKSVRESVGVLGSDLSRGLTEVDASTRLREQGANEIPEAPRHPLVRFVKKFWGLSAWMIELIAVLSFVLRKRADFWIATSLLVVNAILSFLQEQRASAAVAALRQRLQVSSRVLRDGTWRVVPARDLVVGDVVRVRAGDFVPADLQIAEGSVRVDQSALTGESQEVERGVDGALHSGSVVRNGEATAVVTATGVRTYFGRTTQLVETAQPKLHVEEVISRVVRWLFVIVGSLVALTLIMSFVERKPLLDVLPITLVVLMSAVPVALPVMFTVSMALGSLELAKKGVLVTHLGAVEDAATMDVLFADKTGTLTLNRLSLVGALPAAGLEEVDVIRAGALASNQANADPIDLAFLRAAAGRGLLSESRRVLSFEPFSAATRRTAAVVEVGGRRVQVVKGALRTVAAGAGLADADVAALEATANEEAQKGARVLAVARAEEGGPLRFVGLALLRDAPRADSRQLIERLRGIGIGVKMLTGDALPVAREVARQLALGDIVRAPALREASEPRRIADMLAGADGVAEVFPEDKFKVVEGQQSAGHVVGMTGDGVNDAPALRQAEVGIAVSGATDVAKGAASVVLTAEGLGSIVDLVEGGRAIYQRVLTWIVNKISRTILKAGFVVISFVATGRFVISALGMVLLVFMTDFVKITLATDRVHPSRKPETWDIGPLVRVAVVLGLLMLGEALLVLAIGWHRFGLRGGDGRLETFTFQVLLFFAVFSILSVRERGPFWRSRPSTPLALGLVADALAGVAVGFGGFAELRALPWSTSAFVLVWAAVFCLGPNDLVKTMLIRRLAAAARERVPA